MTAFQRIEPKIQLNQAAGIVSAAVWIDPYEETDELSLRGSYGGSSHGIYATYADGVLQMSRIEGHTSPIQWAEILQNVAYKFSDYLKPCSRYRRNYWRNFRFQVTDTTGRTSSIFDKGLTIETGVQACVIHMRIPAFCAISYVLVNCTVLIVVVVFLQHPLCIATTTLCKFLRSKILM